jgi:NADPH:quinone reductase-like Zn-dependent oxidoreductase
MGAQPAQTSTALVFNEYGGPDSQQLIDRPPPQPGPGELAIEVKAAGVNPIDWKIRAGLLGRHWDLPGPMGREASGVVTAVGEGVTDFAVGDEVLGLTAEGHGGLAQHTVLSAKDTVAKPEEISFADAAAVPVAGATAYDVTHQIELEAGQTLLILGAGGGVGLMATQIGKVHQFQVLGVASDSKRELVESTGATFIESGEGAADRVRDVAPDGVDLIVDLVGGDALKAIAPVVKNPTNIISTADSATAEQLGGAGVERSTEGLAKITEVIEYGLVSPNVRQRFSLADANDAVAVVETGHAPGKVVVEP